MRINHKIYNSITTEPFDVQNLENDVVIELHSLNENEMLFNQYAPKAKFSIWSTKDGKTYRLLLEDTYYPRMKDFYGRRVNQCMIDFWTNVEKERSKIMKFIFLPVSILVFIAFILLLIFSGSMSDGGQMLAIGAVLIAFIVVNVIVNKKIDKAVNKHNNEAINRIKHIIGHKRFDELMEVQQAHYDEFFGIDHEEEVEEVQEESVEEVTENPSNEE